VQKVSRPAWVRKPPEIFLLDLGHAHGLFGGVVGEGNVVIGHETPDLIGMSAQAIDEVEGLALLGLASPAGGWGARIDGSSLSQDLGIVGSVVRDAFNCQGAVSCLDFVTGAHQQINQALGPILLHLLEHVGQFAQVVGVTQGMGAGQIAVRFPAIVNQRAGKHGQNPEGIEGLLPRFMWLPIQVSVLVARTCSQKSLPATRIPVSSAWATGTVFRASPMAATVGAISALASSLMDSTVASDIGNPNRSPAGVPVRATGIMWWCVRCTTAALMRGPYCTGAATAAGNSPRCTLPHVQRDSSTWCSVTSWHRGGMSNTWRVSTTTASVSG